MNPDYAPWFAYLVAAVNLADGVLCWLKGGFTTLRPTFDEQQELDRLEL